MKIGGMNNPRLDPYGEIFLYGQNGFDFIDLTIEPPKAFNLDVLKIKEELDKWCLGVVGHTNPGLPATVPIGAIHDESMKALKNTIDFFNALGVEKVNIHPYYGGAYLGDQEVISDNISLLRELTSYCTALGMKLMLENFRSPFNNVKTFEEIIKSIPELYVHLDIGHCNIGGDPAEIVEAFFQTFGDKIIHLHMHDNDGEDDEHMPLGCGSIDWGKIVKILHRYNYDDTITLETFCPDRDYLLMSRDKLIKYWKQRL